MGQRLQEPLRKERDGRTSRIKMPVTGLFFVPTSSADSSPAQELVHRLNEAFEPTPLSPWSLSHRLLRETPSSTQASQTSANLDGPEKAKSKSQRFLQILSLSHHAPRAYVAITASQGPSQQKPGTPAASQQNGETTGLGEPATIISVPAGSVSDDFTSLIVSKFGPLWQSRQILHITNGAAFEVGDFRIRIGELKQGFGGVTQMTRGAICEIEWNDTDSVQQGSTDGPREEEWMAAEPVIRGFWDALDMKGARDVFLVPGLGDDMSSVRQWCEILRIRS